MSIFNTIYKNKERYASFPLLTKGVDENNKKFINCKFFSAYKCVDHVGLHEYLSYTSYDKGKTWKQKELIVYKRREPKDILYADSRQQYDCVHTEYFKTGSVGVLSYDKKRKKIKFSSQINVLRQGQDDFDKFLFPGFEYLFTFPRYDFIGNCCCVSAYGKNNLTKKDNSFVWYTDNCGYNWELIRQFSDNVTSNESDFLFIDGNNKCGYNVLCLCRTNSKNLLQSYSCDYGRTWSYPYFSEIEGFPPHLLILDSGDILCTVGFRDKNYMGIRAYVSYNDGFNWKKLDDLVVTTGYSNKWHKKKLFDFDYKYAWNDIGYPVSIELHDGNILTAYYITRKDKITYIECVNWDIYGKK